MATAPESTDEIVRVNLKRFREDAGYSQAEAAEASGVAIDNLRRYESGRTGSVPYSAIKALSRVYGRSTDDFSSATPPPVKRDELPVFFLRTRPGVDVDQELMLRLQRVIDDANREIRVRRKK